MSAVPEISVVIPAYNEEGNIAEIINKIKEVLQDRHDVEIIFVDDGSTVNTLTEIKQAAQKDSRIFFIHFSRNFGHQAALKAGIDYARGNCIITMDADLQHPPRLIPEMLNYWKQGYDVVYTQRVEEKDISFFKKFTSRFFYFVLKKLSQLPIEEGTADFRLIDRKVADIIKNTHDPFLFIRGFLPWMGFRQKKIVYQPDPRFSGTTKYSLRKMAAFAINGITGFSVKPLRMASFLGIFISLFSFCYAIYAVLIYFTSDKVISGWASMVISVTMIGGIQLIILGIIGEYIGKIYLQLKNRPFYIVGETNIQQ
jgi:dolichol-phosphate mannosyltransferase